MIKHIGQLVGMSIGSIFSPSWALLGLVLKHYFNIAAISQGPQALLAEVLHYQALVYANPMPIFTHVIPGMIAVLILGSIYIWCLGWLGGRLLPAMWQKTQTL